MKMEKLNDIPDRRSIRRYTSQKIGNREIKAILTAAMYAPSVVNMQPWHFVVIDDPSLMEKIMEIHPHAEKVRSNGWEKPFFQE